LSGHFKAAVGFPAKIQFHGDGLAILSINDFSLIFEHVIEVDPCEVAIELFDLCFILGKWESTFVPHGLVVLYWLL
jgi:hypothetical protein